MSSQTQDNREPEDAIVAVRMSPSLRDDLKAIAERNHRTVSGEIRWLIQECVRLDHEREAA
jgi:hypothetical protein